MEEAGIDAERRALAGRLHEGPVQDLTAARLLADAVATRVAHQGWDEEAGELLDRLQAALTAATRSCRDLMAELAPADPPT